MTGRQFSGFITGIRKLFSTVVQINVAQQLNDFGFKVHFNLAVYFCRGFDSKGDADIICFNNSSQKMGAKGVVFIG
jgi:hypothetical protein